MNAWLLFAVAALVTAGCRDGTYGGAGGAGDNPCGMDCNGIQLTYVCTNDGNCSCLGATSTGCIQHVISGGGGAGGGAGAGGSAGQAGSGAHGQGPHDAGGE